MPAACIRARTPRAQQSTRLQSCRFALHITFAFSPSLQTFDQARAVPLHGTLTMLARAGHALGSSRNAARTGVRAWETYVA